MANYSGDLIPLKNIKFFFTDFEIWQSEFLLPCLEAS